MTWRFLRRRRPIRTGLPERMADVRALHIGGYWRGPNDTVRHMMLGLRAAGATVRELNTDEHPELLDTEGRPYDRGTTGPVWIRLERLREPLEAFRPNLIICNAGGLGFRPADVGRLPGGAFLLGIALSDPDVWEPTTRHIAPQFDAFLTNAPDCVARYQALGVRCATLPLATNKSYYRPVPPCAALRCDVLVMGHAHPDRIEPVRSLRQRFETHVYGEGWDGHGISSRGLVLDEEALAALNSARVTVVFFRTRGGHVVVKPGLFDFAAAGALVLTNRCAEVEPYFLYGEEILGFSDTPERLATVADVLGHPEEADRVRHAGRQRVLRDHTWRVVWPRVIARVRTL